MSFPIEIPPERTIFVSLRAIRIYYNNNMEQVKHDTAVENSVKRYASPEVKVVFVKAQAIICQSNGNSSLYEKNLDENDFEVI